MAEKKVPLSLENLPGVWQLREGPRFLGVTILTSLLICVGVLVLRFDRILATVGFSEIEGMRVGLGDWFAFFTLLIFPPLLCWAARKRPPQPRYGKGQWTLVWERFMASPQAHIGLFMVMLLSLAACLATYIAPYDPIQILDIEDKLRAPSLDFLIGTDKFPRDLASRILYGAQISLTIGLLAISLSASLGLVVGMLSGYFGGWVDNLLMRIVDVMLSYPRLVLLLVIMSLWSKAFTGLSKLYLTIAILGVTGWMGTARLVRGEVLSLKERDFVQAGRALGLSNMRIMFRHIAPNCLAPVIVSATLGIGGTILVEAALSFLGLGVPPPIPSWGAMVSDGQDYIVSAWWISFFPGIAIVFSVMAFNLLGDGLRDALDPRLVSMGGAASGDDEPEPDSDGEQVAKEAA